MKYGYGQTGAYNATPVTLTDQDPAAVALDQNANAKTNMATGIAGEDLANDVLKVEQRFSFLNITLAAPTTTVVKSGTGVLHAIVINKTAATGVITVYDNTAGSGTLIGTITQPAAVLASQEVITYDCSFTVGLTIVTATAAQDITVIFR